LVAFLSVFELPRRFLLVTMALSERAALLSHFHGSAFATSLKLRRRTSTLE